MGAGVREVWCKKQGMIMMNAFKSIFSAAAVAVALSAGGAGAVTVNVQGATNTDLLSLSTAGTVALPAGASFDRVGITSGSLGSGESRSPFDGLGAGNFEEIEYFTVGTPSLLPDSKSPATLLYTGLQTSFKILWGSVDVYNTLAFYKGDTLVTTLVGGVGVAPATGKGASIVTLTELQFDKVVFTSRGAAFEFSNIESTAIPLPAGGVLLLTALGGIAVLRRRKLA